VSRDPRARCGYIAEVVDESEPQLDVRNYDAFARSKPLAGKKVLNVADDGSASIYLAHSIGMTVPTVVTVDTDNTIDVTLCGYGGCSADRWVRNEE
jgi:rhodanese-related sulfurtransferase